LKFIHTSDWQIGRVFRFVDDVTMSLLQEARLDVISEIGKLAVKEGALAVLVAGDVYDMEGISERTLLQPIERMRKFTSVEWHLLPGNHDAAKPDGLWDRLQRRSLLPSNVHLHLSPEPIPIVEGKAWLLPAPLQRRASMQDLTAYMDESTTPQDVFRIGLAHGSVTSFSSHEASNTNTISPNRAQDARLDYLALGDWHGYKKINDRCYYSGTPETDAFDVEDGFNALVIELSVPGALPQVKRVELGKYRWHKLGMSITSSSDIDVLETRIRALSDSLETVLLRLTVSGALSLVEHQYFEDRIRTSTLNALRYGEVDDKLLLVNMQETDWEALELTGYIRQAVIKLKSLAADVGNSESPIAQLALQKIYLEHVKQVSS
jgi:DNA repair exonuclease SbcCD nuclease subunit